MAWTARQTAWAVGMLLLALTGCVAGPPTVPPKPLTARDSIAAQRCNAQGLELIDQGRVAEAETLFRQALEADPFYGPARANLGVALLQQGQPYEAGWQLQHACQLMPKASPPRANLALLFERVGRYGSAEEQLRKALELAPDDIEVIGHLARVHVRQGKHTEETLAWLQSVATQDESAAWRDWARREVVKVVRQDHVAGR